LQHVVKHKEVSEPRLSRIKKSRKSEVPSQGQKLKPRFWICEQRKKRQVAKTPGQPSRGVL